MANALFLSGLVEFTEDSVQVITYEQYSGFRRANGRDPEVDPANFPQSIEFEFSSNILISNHSIGGEFPSDFRYIYYGDYQYNPSGVMTSARIDSVIAVFRNPETGTEFGYLHRTANPTVVSDASNFLSWEDAMQIAMDDNTTVEHSYRISEGQLVALKGAGRDAIFTSLTSNLLPSNWYDELFSSDLLRGANSSAITGTEGDDVIETDNGDNFKDDIISTGGGNDSISAMRGADRVNAGDGNDFIHGNHGRDVLDGGNGNDTIRGGHGPDQIFGGNGGDWIWGGIGRNTVDAGAGDSARDDIYVPVDSINNTQYGNPGGANFDPLLNLGAEDKIYIHGEGISNASLTFGATSFGGYDGIGIYANGTLEALVTGGFSAEQVQGMTTGGFFA